MIKSITQVLGAIVLLWVLFFICIQFAAGTTGAAAKIMGAS